MEQSQLFELISALSPAEKDQIRQFSSLTFFNPSKLKAHVPVLLEICFGYSGLDGLQSLEKNLVFEVLFPGQEFVEGKLEKVMVEAHKVVRTSLLVLRYLNEENDFQQDFDFSQILRNKNQESRYSKMLMRLQKSQANKPVKDASFFYQQFQLEYAIHKEDSIYNKKKGDLNIPNVLFALESHGQLHKLALLNRFLLQRKVTKLELPTSIKVILGEIQPSIEYLEHSPALLLNYEIFKLLKADGLKPADIRKLLGDLRREENNLDQESLQEFYTYIRNLCILTLNMDFVQLEIENLLHELYKDNLARGFLHYEGKILSSRYWAVSSNAIRVKAFDWALNFIERYKAELVGENETQDLYRLNLANYLFGIGDYAGCLDHIPPNSPFIDYMLTGKRLEIKAYYELKSDLLPYKLEAFKVFLSRTSPKLLPESQKQSLVDFANLLTQITNSKSGDPTRSDRIVKRIQEKKQAAEWRWLMEKAKALKVVQ